jgi:predicted ferric reductase
LILPFQDGGATLAQLMNRAAFLALANSAFVFPLATRNSVFLTLIGVPFERIIRFHRWVGRMVFIMVALHGFTQIQNRYRATNSAYDALWGDHKQRNGFLALLAVTIVTVTSHSLVRRYAFEVFYWGHFNFIAFFIFGALHNEWFLPFVGFGGALYVADRFIRAMSSLETTRVVGADALQSGVSRIVFEREMSHYPGQYVFVNFPGLGGILSYILWHPVSLSSSTQFYDDIPYHSVHIKTSGGFTSSLYKSVVAGNISDHGNLRMRVDGPYGRPSIDCSEHRIVMLCAGGIGVTPIISILKDLVDHQVAGVNIVTQAIYFVWVVPDVSTYP